MNEFIILRSQDPFDFKTTCIDLLAWADLVGRLCYSPGFPVWRAPVVGRGPSPEVVSFFDVFTYTLRKFDHFLRKKRLKSFLAQTSLSLNLPLLIRFQDSKFERPYFSKKYLDTLTRPTEKTFKTGLADYIFAF